MVISVPNVKAEKSRRKWDLNQINRLDPSLITNLKVVNISMTNNKKMK